MGAHTHRVARRVPQPAVDGDDVVRVCQLGVQQLQQRRAPAGARVVGPGQPRQHVGMQHLDLADAGGSRQVDALGLAPTRQPLQGVVDGGVPAGGILAQVEEFQHEALDGDEERLHLRVPGRFGRWWFGLLGQGGGVWRRVVIIKPPWRARPPPPPSAVRKAPADDAPDDPERAPTQQLKHVARRQLHRPGR